MEWISSLWEFIKNNKFVSFFVLFITGILQNIIANISTPDSSIVISFFNKIFSSFQSNISIKLWILILLILILQVIIFSILLLFPNIRNGFIKEFQDIKKDDGKEKNSRVSDKKVILTILFIILLPIGLYLLLKSRKQTEKTSKLSDKEIFLIWYFYISNKKNISSYTSDTFYDIKWLWNWKKNDDKLIINNLTAICPECNYELKKGNYIDLDINNKISTETKNAKKLLKSLEIDDAIVTSKPYSYICDDCDYSKDFKSNILNLEEKIKKKIWQQVHNKKLVYEQI